jgi:hypothetical protein
MSIKPKYVDTSTSPLAPSNRLGGNRLSARVRAVGRQHVLLPPAARILADCCGRGSELAHADPSAMKSLRMPPSFNASVPCEVKIVDEGFRGSKSPELGAGVNNGVPASRC